MAIGVVSEQKVKMLAEKLKEKNIVKIISGFS